MQQNHFFCATASRNHGESIYGTVAHIRSWLLLEYPSAWRRRAIEDSRLLSDGVKSYLAALKEQGHVDRSLLVRREHFRSGPLHCFVVQSCGTPRIMRRLLENYDDLVEPQAAAESVDGLLYGVCTHGRHDKCCAKFGIPVHCAFQNQAGERAWQCSHVGGDRFAANVVVFPHGLYYGRVTPEEAGEIIRRSEAGEIWLDRYRGRSCYPRNVQVAEYFLRVESGKRRIDAFRPLEVRRRDALVQVRFEDRADRTIHVVEFATRTDVRRELLTCGATEPSAVPQYDLTRYSVSVQ